MDDRETVRSSASAIASVSRKRITPERHSAPGEHVDEPFGKRPPRQIRAVEAAPAFDTSPLDTPRLRPPRRRIGTLEIVDPASASEEALQRTFVTLTMAGTSGPNGFHVLGDRAVTIGRDPSNEIIVDDLGTSGQHARVVHEDGVHLLEDLFSTNGTFVNGVRINRHRLADGDRIQLGCSAQLTVRHQDEVELSAARQLHESATRDPLTGITNRRHFQERLLSEWAFAIRHKTPLTLMILDVDHFKRVNDEYGHLGGDATLVTLARTLTSMIRAEDVVARYGGEEFTILARALDEEKGYFFAERIRGIIETLSVPFRKDPIRFTASIGVATTTRERPMSDPRALFEAADSALYKAKRIGRNRVVSAEPT